MDEASLIREIVEHPELEEPKLVYADWLEERGDSRAEFLRLQCEFDSFEFDHSAVKDLKADLMKYWETIDHEWLNQVATKYDVWYLSDAMGSTTFVKLLQRIPNFGLAIALDKISNNGPSRILWGLDLQKAEASRRMIGSVANLFPISKLILITPQWRKPPEESVQEI